MELDDRDNMRARYRERQGLSGTYWNSKKSRVEQSRADQNKDVPLGSASWIASASEKAGWFDRINRGQDCGRGQYRSPKRARLRPGSLPFALSTVLAAFGTFGAFGGVERQRWIPDFKRSMPFPQSGSVTVSKRLGMKRFTSRLSVITDDANAVVQLIAPESGHHAMSVYRSAPQGERAYVARHLPRAADRRPELARPAALFRSEHRVRDRGRVDDVPTARRNPNRSSSSPRRQPQDPDDDRRPGAAVTPGLTLCARMIHHPDIPLSGARMPGGFSAGRRQ